MQLILRILALLTRRAALKARGSLIRISWRCSRTKSIVRRSTETLANTEVKRGLNTSMAEASLRRRESETGAENLRNRKESSDTENDCSLFHSRLVVWKRFESKLSISQKKGRGMGGVLSIRGRRIFAGEKDTAGNDQASWALPCGLSCIGKKKRHRELWRKKQWRFWGLVIVLL